MKDTSTNPQTQRSLTRLALVIFAVAVAVAQSILAAPTDLYLPKGTPFKLRYMNAPKLILEPLPLLPITSDPQPLSNPAGPVASLPDLPATTTKYEARTQIIQITPVPITPAVVDPNLKPSGMSLLRYFPISTNATTIIDLNAVPYFQPPIRGSKATYQK